jgi:hypothetical protein
MKIDYGLDGTRDWFVCYISQLPSAPDLDKERP